MRRTQKSVSLQRKNKYGMKKSTFGIILLLIVLAVSGCSDKKRDAIGHTEVVLETSMGKITLRLYDDTPLHRDNFVRMEIGRAHV